MKKFLHTILMTSLPVLAMAGICNPTIREMKHADSPAALRQVLAGYVSKQLKKSYAKDEGAGSVAKAPALNYDGQWQPQKMEYYRYWNSDWELLSVSLYQYGDAGQLNKEWYIQGEDNESFAMECTYSYDESGRTTGYVVSVEGEDYVRTEILYDSVVTDQIVGVLSYSIDVDGSYTLEEGWISEITRDADGRVTEDVLSEVENGKTYPIDRYVITYGTDGIASEIIYYENSTGKVNPKWTEEMRMKDIVWNRTDSQFFFTLDDVADDMDEFAKPDLFSGANRIESSTMKMAGVGMPVVVTVAYSGEKDYDVMMKMADFDMLGLNVTFTDEFGSMHVLMTSIEEMDDDAEYIYQSIDVTYDRFGLMTYLEAAEWYEAPELEPEYTMGQRGDVTYDEKFGYPTEITYTLVYDGRDMDPQARYVLSDYTDIAGVAEVTADGEKRYFTLEGLPVRSESLSPGIYIVREGSRAAKIAVR